MQDPKTGSSRNRPRITAGDIYMVRDEESADVGYCVITQATRGSIQIGYFFDPSASRLEDLVKNKDKVHLDAVCVLWFGYIGIRDGDWPLVGKVRDFKTGDWPIAVGVWREIDRLPYYACLFDTKTLTLGKQIPMKEFDFKDGDFVLISCSLAGYISASRQFKQMIMLNRRAFMECGC